MYLYNIIIADVINEHLLAVQTNTSTVCGEGTLEESYIAAAFLINRIRVPDMASDNRLLFENGWNRIHKNN